MARKEEIKKGRIPLQTFRADIDFAKGSAKLPYGAIGIKVWIYKGEVFPKINERSEYYFRGPSPLFWEGKNKT